MGHRQVWAALLLIACEGGVTGEPPHLHQADWAVATNGPNVWEPPAPEPEPEPPPNPLEHLEGCLVWLDAGRPAALCGADGEPAFAGEPAVEVELAGGKRVVAVTPGIHAPAPEAHPTLSALALGPDTRYDLGQALHAGPYTYVAVYRRRDTAPPTQAQGIISAHGGRSGIYALGDHVGGRAFGSGPGYEWLLTPEPAEGWLIVIARWSGRWHDLTVNGRRVQAGPRGPGYLPGHVMIGNGESSADVGLDGYLGELAVFDRALADEELDALSAYLAHRWDVPLAHDDAPACETGALVDTHAITALSIAPDAPLRFGRPTRLRVHATGPFGTVGVPPSQLTWTTTGATVDPCGRLLATGLDPVTVAVQAGDLSAEITLGVGAPSSRSFVDEGDLPLGTPEGAHQGLEHHDGLWYATNNLKSGKSHLYRFNPELELSAQLVIPRPGDPGNHAGAPAGHADRLYVTFMDTATLGSAAPITGLSVIATDPLGPVDFIDTTGVFRYLDALDIHNDHLWVSEAGDLVRIPLTDEGPLLDQRVRYPLVGIKALQGIRVSDHAVWTVPENTTNPADLLGLLVYDRDRLVPQPHTLPPTFQAALMAAPGRLNLPSHRYPVRVPEHAPDMESFEFDPEDPTVALIPWIPGSGHLARIRLSVP